MDIPGCVRLRWGMRDEQLEKLISSYGEEAEPLGITSQCTRAARKCTCHEGLSENRVYTPNYSHLIGIMIIDHWV